MVANYFAKWHRISIIPVSEKHQRCTDDEWLNVSSQGGARVKFRRQPLFYNCAHNWIHWNVHPFRLIKQHLHYHRQSLCFTREAEEGGKTKSPEVIDQLSSATSQIGYSLLYLRAVDGTRKDSHLDDDGGWGESRTLLYDVSEGGKIALIS